MKITKLIMLAAAALSATVGGMAPAVPAAANPQWTRLCNEQWDYAEGKLNDYWNTGYYHYYESYQSGMVIYNRYCNY